MLDLTPKAEIVYRDASGSTAALTLHFPHDTAVTAAFDASMALGAVVASLTGAVLLRLRIKYQTRVETRTAADEGASIARCGAFFFSTSDDTALGIITIPGIKSDIILSTGIGAGVLIDLSNADVTAFLAVATNGDYTDVFGDVMGELVAAYRQSRT